MDLSRILDNPYAGKEMKVTFDPSQVYDFKLEETVDQTILMKKLKASLEKNRNGVSKSMSPTSTVLSAHSLVLRSQNVTVIHWMLIPTL